MLIAIALLACVARNAQAQTPDDERTEEDLRAATAVSKRHRAELMKIPHVTIVTGEIDEQNEAAILVEVDKQKAVDAVTRQLPPKIEGFPVEVDVSSFEVKPGRFGHPAPKEAGNDASVEDPPAAATKPDGQPDEPQ